MDREALFVKAAQYLLSAETLIDLGDYDSAASRIYYAMFYVAEALLDKLGLAYSSHKAVIAAYGKHFAKTEKIDPRFHKVLIQAFETRQLGDYLVKSGITLNNVKVLLSEANAFLNVASEWLTAQT